MGRVLAISSQVIWGPVGNTAAVPALQYFGHEVMQVPTVLLSNHPGHGAPEGRATDAALFAAMLARVEGLGALTGLDGVMTGYFASAAQVQCAAALIRRVRPAQVLVDPVIGDHGRLYVSEEVARAIRDELVPLASILTPNVFELGWLTGKSSGSRGEISDAVAALECGEVVVTSAEISVEHITTLMLTGDDAVAHQSLRKEAVPHGTGDALAGLFLGARIGMAPTVAFAKAMDRLDKITARSAGESALVV